MNEMLLKAKEITALAKMSPNGAEPLANFLQGFSSLLDCGVCLRGLDGSILFETQYLPGSNNFEDIASNAEIKTEENISYATFPVVCKGTQCGTMEIGKRSVLQDFEAVLTEVASVFVAQELQHGHEREKDQAFRLKNAVKQSLDALSYSEKAAFASVVRELAGNEGVLVASKIAERDGIKRSAIVNAIRKLESAGIIESRSLGVKGTFIRIINPQIFSALEMEV